MFKPIQRVMNQAGMAMDEIILFGIMLASLGGFALVNVPWGDIVGSNAQISSMLNQIESANNEFYNRYHMWPHQTTDGSAKNNAYALVSAAAMRYPYNNMLAFSSLLPDVEVSRSEARLRHNFGVGGTISQRVVTRDDDRYIEIILSGVPWDEARKLDEKIDNSYDPTSGKVRLMFDNTTDGMVNVHYQANIVSRI